MIEYILISYVVMLIRFIYVVTIKGYQPPSSNVNVSIGMFIGFVLIVGFAPISFIVFTAKSIFK